MDEVCVGLTVCGVAGVMLIFGFLPWWGEVSFSRYITKYEFICPHTGMYVW